MNIGAIACSMHKLNPKFWGLFQIWHIKFVRITEIVCDFEHNYFGISRGHVYEFVCIPFWTDNLKCLISKGK